MLEHKAEFYRVSAVQMFGTAAELNMSCDYLDPLSSQRAQHFPVFPCVDVNLRSLVSRSS